MGNLEYRLTSMNCNAMVAMACDYTVAEVEEIVPVGQLTFDKYKHKQYGWIHNPVFAIKEWRTPDDASPVEGGAPADEPAKEEPKRTRAAVEPDPKADEQDEDLGKEYAETAAAEAATPRRRQRR